MKNRIIEILDKNKKFSLDRSAILKEMKSNKSSDFILLDKALTEMEADGEILRDSKNRYSTPKGAGLVEGVLHLNKKGMGFIDRDDEPSILIVPEQQKSAMEGDTVLVKVLKNESLYVNTIAGSVFKVVKRNRKTIVGTFEPRGKGLRFVPDDEKLKGMLVSMSIPSKFTPVAGMKAVMKITQYGSPIEIEMEKELGYKDDPGVDILSVLMEHDINPEFSDEVMDQVAQIPQEVSEDEKVNRTDLTKDITVTIDGDDSKDFDDAVSVKAVSDGWILKVSIADVTHYVHKGSPIDQEAAIRGTSTYAVNSVVPMLPHALSNGICSLNPHVVRLTNTCEMHIGKDGKVIDYKVYPSYICSTERMTYGNVNKILDGDQQLISQYEHLGSIFTDLRDCADAIRSERENKGAIDFETTESKIIVNEKGHPVEIRKVERGHAERMIEDCMIAANVCVADLMHHHEYPSVYRVHGEPSIKRLKDYARMSALLGHPFDMNRSSNPKHVQEYLASCADSEAYPVLATMMLRSMQKAKYDPTCLGHYGLAETEYLHFTSPIRRYPDLLVHRMLRKYYFEGRKTNQKQDEASMRDFAESCSIRERISADAEYAAADMKKAEYMESRIGEVYEGIISGVTSYGFFVELENTVEGLVRVEALKDDYYSFDSARMMLVGNRTNHTYHLGKKVRIKVVSASKDEGKVDFELDEKRSDSRRLERKKYNTRSRAAKKADQFETRENRSFDRKKTRDHKDNRDFNRKHDRHGKKDFKKRDDFGFKSDRNDSRSMKSKSKDHKSRKTQTRNGRKRKG